MINGLITLKRTLTLLLVILIGLGWYVSQNLTPLSVKLLNRLLTPYNIQVLNLDSQFISINQLVIPRLILQTEDSYIAIQDFELELTDTLSIIQNQRLAPSDIVKLTTKSIYVDLGESFFNRQAKQQTETSAAWQLVFNQIPHIDLGEVLLLLPEIHSQGLIADKIRHQLKMDYFILTPAGELNTQWRFDDRQLFSLSAMFTPVMWSFESKLNFTQSQLGLNALSHYLTAALKLDATSDDKAVNTSVSHGAIFEAQQRLQAILQPINDNQIAFNGNWHAKINYDLPSQSIQSTHHFTELSVASQLWPELGFSLAESFKLDVDIGNQLMPHRLNTPPALTYSALVSIPPVNQQFQLSDKQLLQLITRITTDKKAQEYLAFINRFKAGVRAGDIAEKPNKSATPLDFKLSINGPSQLWINLDDNQNSSFSFNTSKITASLENLIFDNQFLLTNIALNDKAEVKFDVKLALKSATKTDLLSLALPADVIAKPTLDKALIANSLTYNNLSLDLQSEFSKTLFDEQLPDEYLQTFTIKPNSHLNGSLIHFKNKTTSSLLAAKAELNLTQTSTLVNKLGKTELQLSPLSLVIKDATLNNQQGLSTDESLPQSSLTKTFQSKLINVLWQPNTKFDFINDDKHPLDVQLKNQASQHLIDATLSEIKLQQTSINQASGKSRRQTLLNLDLVNLSQKLKIKDGIISSKDHWQFDTITANSQHLIQPSSKTIAGQWQLDTELIDAMPTVSKNQPIATGLNIAGKASINSSFSFTERADKQLFEMRLNPEFSRLNIDYLDNYILDGYIFSQCQFNWQKNTEEQYASSHLSCPESQITIAKGKSGLLFDNLKLTANIDLGVNPDKPLNNWLQKITGLSNTDIKLTAEGELLDGKFIVPEFVVKLHDKSTGYLLLQGLSLQKFLEQQPQVGVYADGIFDGVLPAEFADGKFSFSGGNLAARQPGGLIQVADNPAIEELKQTQPYLTLVFDALAHLEYQQLSSTFDMQTNGDAQINISVKGKSKDIVRPIHLNYAHEENLIQLYKSTQIGHQLESTIEKSIN
ncbi:YdbH domain-containing protein [Shewanella aestuarii]|uniref:Uncharacterized protein n=1 Tax=Shewanella aestuarii TaxID=1028752 RepID=A0A6G9QK47_9GAMM|nr:YdbH domain-containing protein [Shewanella aestuarii]QIR14758.1 hypothetical protein HBH39_09895 [Shewanella aestuarii]